MSILVEPSEHYKESFLEGLREFHQEGLLRVYDYQRTRLHFGQFLEQLQRQQTLAPPDVASTDYWLIEEEEFIGRLSLRCNLTPFLFKVVGHIGYQVRPSKRRQGYGTELLHLGLIKALEHGLTRALVTCDETNVASRKVIEHNGGIFENSVSVEGSPVPKLRYWIDLSCIPATPL